jgi:SAM-dependent methyltransferase
MSQVRFTATAAEDEQRRRESPWWGVHVARYRFAIPHLLGCSVLDIACGSGYGLPVLQKTARSVVGVDVDMDAARKARNAVGCGPEVVVVADGCRLPFDNASFDVITSFETLEHLEARARFLGELRRVLTPKGLCIISTPNANHTLPVNGRPRNPHHVFEYSPSELVTELRNHFASIELFGQILDSRFVISPFLDEQERMPRTAQAQAKLLLWRVINKMPIGVRDHLSQAVWGHPLFPGDLDYQFTPAAVEVAPVLMALCRGAASE